VASNEENVSAWYLLTGLAHAEAAPASSAGAGAGSKGSVSSSGARGGLLEHRVQVVPSEKLAGACCLRSEAAGSSDVESWWDEPTLACRDVGAARSLHGEERAITLGTCDSTHFISSLAM